MVTSCSVLGAGVVSLSEQLLLQLLDLLDDFSGVSGVELVFSFIKAANSFVFRWRCEGEHGDASQEQEND